MALTQRAQHLREQMVTLPAICVERLRYMTDSYRQTEGESNLMRRAKALAYILEHMTVRIDEGELFVGNFTSKIRGGAIAPELKGQWLLDELDTLSTRPFDRYAPLSQEELDTLRECLPYWKGKSAFEFWQTMVPPEYQRLDHIMVATGGYSENGHHWAHTAADYEKLLKIGSLGIIEEAERHLAALDYTDPTAQNRRQFYLAVQVVTGPSSPLPGAMPHWRRKKLPGRPTPCAGPNSSALRTPAARFRHSLRTRCLRPSSPAGFYMWP